MNSFFKSSFINIYFFKDSSSNFLKKIQIQDLHRHFLIAKLWKKPW